MMNEPTRKKPNYFYALFNHKCPHCRQGNMFVDRSSYHLKSFMMMNKKCPVCGQKTEIEAGFYYSTGYVSYALTVAFSVASFVAWWVLAGFSSGDNRIFRWLGINTFLLLLIQPYLMRLSGTVWLAVFVKYDVNRSVKKPTFLSTKSNQ